MIDAPLGPLRRTMLAEDRVAAIRAARRRPRPTMLDYHHLRLLRGALTAALASVPPVRAALDLFCGSRPYDALVPAQQVVGVDIDLHFRGASVVSTLPLPFADDTFGLAVCTQALYLIDDPVAAVGEMARVVGPGGHVVVTVPSVYRRELPHERLWSAAELAALFDGWQDIRVRPVGGPGHAAVYALGRIVGGAVRRVPALRPVLPVSAVVLAGLGWVLGPPSTLFARRWPHMLVLIATRPA